MEISSALTLEMLGKPFLLEKRIVLLHAIKEHGSISKAAKSVPMSYKSAWEAVDMMNSLSCEPIVCRETGGKDGGGTTITSYGEELLKNYALLKEEHTRFLERLSILTDIRSGTFKTIGRLAMQLSARNQIQAEVIRIVSHNVNAEVHLKLKSRQILVSVITQEAVDNLHLKAGEIVTAIFKSSAVEMDTKSVSTAHNHIEGQLVHSEHDKDNIKIVVDIGGHDKIIAVVPHTHKHTVSLQVDMPIVLMIKYSDVMVGK